METPERMAMIELTTVDGSVLWLIIGTIWAIEKSPNETFTIVRTASEPVMVMESPATIFARIQKLMMDASAEEMRQYAEAVGGESTWQGRLILGDQPSYLGSSEDTRGGGQE